MDSALTRTVTPPKINEILIESKISSSSAPAVIAWSIECSIALSFPNKLTTASLISTTVFLSSLEFLNTCIQILFHSFSNSKSFLPKLNENPL